MRLYLKGISKALAHADFNTNYLRTESLRSGLSFFDFPVSDFEDCFHLDLRYNTAAKQTHALSNQELPFIEVGKRLGNF